MFQKIMQFMRSKLVRVCAAFALCLAFVHVAKATGVADTDISQGADNVSATWGYVKTILVPIGVFLVAWGFFKKLRRA